MRNRKNQFLEPTLSLLFYEKNCCNLIILFYFMFLIKIRKLSINKQYIIWGIVLLLFNVFDILRHFFSHYSFLEIGLKWSMYSFLNGFTILFITYFFNRFCNLFFIKTKLNNFYRCFVFVLGFNFGLFFYSVFGSFYLRLLNIDKILIFNQSVIPHLITSAVVILVWLIINVKIIKKWS